MDQLDTQVQDFDDIPELKDADMSLGIYNMSCRKHTMHFGVVRCLMSMISFFSLSFGHPGLDLVWYPRKILGAASSCQDVPELPDDLEQCESEDATSDDDDIEAVFHVEINTIP